MKRISKLLSIYIFKLKKFFIDVIDRKKSLISFFTFFLGAICLMVSGATNSDTKTYSSALYVANLVEHDNHATHVAVIAEQKENGIVPDTATELRSLYGAFGNRESNYAGTINASKNGEITFADFEQEERLSFVYVQTGVQVSDKKDDDGTIHHRMEFYPLELMFEFYPNDPHSFYSFLYLSTSQARKVIDLRYPGLFEEDISLDELLKNNDFILKCKEIIGTGVNIKFNETIKNFQITNIFYEKDYFYNIVHRTVGEFLVGYNQYPEGFQKQATYFLNKYEYQNKFYLNYIKEKYSIKKCNFDTASVGMNATINNKLVFECFNQTSNVTSIILLVTSFVFLGFGFVFMFKFRLYNLTFVLYAIVSLMMPFAVGFILWKITDVLAFFSPFFTIALLSTLIIVSTVFICYSLVLRRKVGNE